MKIDWKNIIGHLTGTGGWEEAEGPQTGVGDVDYWMDDLGKTVRLHSDQGHYELWLLPSEGDVDAERLLWQGDREILMLDPGLGKYTSPDAGNKDATVRFDPVNELAPYKAVYEIAGQMTSYRFPTAEAAAEELSRAGYRVTVEAPSPVEFDPEP